MPRRKTDQPSIHEQLAAASARLREVGSPELAEAVDSVLTPTGWGRLRRSQVAKEGTLARNLPMRTDEPIRAHIRAAAEAAGDDLTQKVNEGLAKFVAGEFVPARPERAKHGTVDESSKVNMNVRADETLREQADQRGAEIQAELGWRPYVSQVALAYLLHLYPLPDNATAE